MSTFDRAFAVIIGEEGGFSNERADSGNWTGGAVGKGALHGTKYGIDAATYPTLDIAGLTLDQAKAIYQRDYWAKLRCDELPPQLALLVFDAAANNGPGAAIRWLQVAANTGVDGNFGPATMAAITSAVASQGADTFCAEFLAQRFVYMAALPTWRTFGLGWARRLCALSYESLQLAGAAPATKGA